MGHTYEIMASFVPLGRFVPWDVLSLGTFCPLGRFVLWDVLSLGTFCSLGRFVPGMFCPWDVLSLGRFVPGTLCLGTFCLGTFCMCIGYLLQLLQMTMSSEKMYNSEFKYIV